MKHSDMHPGDLVIKMHNPDYKELEISQFFNKLLHFGEDNTMITLKEAMNIYQNSFAFEKSDFHQAKIDEFLKCAFVRCFLQLCSEHDEKR